MMDALSVANLVSFEDLSGRDVRRILDTAEDMARAIGFDGDAPPIPVAPLDRILGIVFFEPSPRTRLSFESAMLRLGGQTLGFYDAANCSVAKGETLADTIRVMSGYCDILVMRHPLSGAAKVAADAAKVPVINAGDGHREHPTQTLTDLFCIRRELKRLDGLKVGLCGDLKHGRTVHSLAPVLAQMGCEIICISPPELPMPERYMTKIQAASGTRPVETDDLQGTIADLDVLYMTRMQRERFADSAEYDKITGCFVLTPEMMEKGREQLKVLHPLPRIDEIAPEVDEDPRAAYFRQAAGGVPVRMALLALLLRLPEYDVKDKSIGLGKAPRYTEAAPEVVAPKSELQPVPGKGPCRNQQCITTTEPVEPAFVKAEDGPVICAYCEEEQTEH